MRYKLLIVIVFLAVIMISIVTPALSDNPPGLVINGEETEYTAYIYGDAYEEYLNSHGESTDIYISYPPLKYTQGYCDNIRYYPVSFFVYNRWTFYDEATMFEYLIGAGHEVLGKELVHYTVYDNTKKPILGPIFIIDSFHAYANNIWSSPTTDNISKVFQRYDAPGNNYNVWYKPFAGAILSEIAGLEYDYKHDPLGAITNISGIAVFYLPTSPNIVAQVGWDKRSNKPIISSALILSIVNSREHNRLAQIVYLNPMMFVHLENKYHGKIPDIVVLVSPAAGLDDEDLEEIKQYYPGLKGEWIPITKLLHDLGARVVVGTKILPDTYDLLPIQTSQNTLKYNDTPPFFPYITNDWLQLFFQYLSQGYTVEQSATWAASSVNYEKENDWYTFIQAVNWSSYQLDKIIEATERLRNLINESLKISELVLLYENGIYNFITSLDLLAAAEEYKLEEIVKEYYYQVLESSSKILIKYTINKTETFYKNAIQGFEELISMFIAGRHNEKLFQHLIINSMYGDCFSVTIIGNGNYHLNDPDPPDPPGGDGHHSPIDNPGFNYMT